MGQLTQNVLFVSSGSFHFIPSGSNTRGISQSFDSTPQTYAVTMSGASLSQSVLAPIGETASYFYLRQPDGFSTKFYFKSYGYPDPYNGVLTSSVEPTGSDLPYEITSTPSSSNVCIKLPFESTGSEVFQYTVRALNAYPYRSTRVAISSSDNQYIFFGNTVTGAPPVDDFSLDYISGSSFSYSVPTSGSGLLNQNATQGLPVAASSSIVAGLVTSSDDIDQFNVSAPVTAPSASFSHFGSDTQYTTIRRARFKGKSDADIFEFSNLTITTANSESYLTKHKDYYDDVPYYKLDVSDQGAMFVRIDCELNYPISRIEPPTVSSTKAHLIFIENASYNTSGKHTIYISRENQTGLSPGVTDEIGFDTGDFLSPSFKETVLNVPASGVAGAIHGNVTYSSSLALDHGARLMCVRSKFDWKVQSLSDYTGTEVKFADISATSFSGSFTGSINGGVF